MTVKSITMNTLFYGDNLPILRDHIQDESIDLIYLDPPFNSNRSYNVLFREEGGLESEAQISAWSTNSINRYDADTIASLCEYFDCSVGDLIVYESSNRSRK